MVKSLRISLKLNRSNNNLEGHERLTPRNFFESYSVDAKFCILMHFWCYNPESKLCPEMMFFSLFQAKKKSEFIIIYFYILPIINCPIDCYHLFQDYFEQDTCISPSLVLKINTFCPVCNNIKCKYSLRINSI